jgi:uncharacterized protein (DUF58 family)
MSERFAPPVTPLVTIPGIAFQTAGVFLLPLVVALPAAMLLQASEVGETAGPMLLFAGAVLGPVFLVQVLGLLLKSRREILFWRAQGVLGPARWLDVLYRHLRVVTVRGWALLTAGTLTTVIALAAKWAAFGLLAVLALLLFYGVVGWTIFVSTFLTTRIERGLQRDKGSVTRKVSPAVVLAGERTEEVFTFRRVVVPWGYYLLVDDPNPVRLGTPSRHAVGAAASAGEVEQRTTLRRTPRGHWFLGPAPIWYQDVLGITRVSVVSYATAELKVLPPIPAVSVVEPPRSRLQVPDVVTKPHRFATEDHFRFREYASGDDTRRIQWRLSMRAGQLHVRLPEARETSTNQVLLVLDSYLPKGQILDAATGAEEILDALVLAWLGIAKELVERGDHVTLIAATSGERKGTLALQQIACNRNPAARWQDIGARVRWQGRWDVPEMLAEIGDDVHGVVCTARFTAAPPGALPGQSLSWLFLDPADALGPADPHWFTQVVGGQGPLAVARWIFRLPAPIASEDNALLPRLQASWQIHRRWSARGALRAAARRRAGATRAELQRRGDAVYRIERTARGIKLVGLSAASGPVGGRR